MSRAQHHVNEINQVSTDAEQECGGTISEDQIDQELSVLVDQGFLSMGVSSEGESIFWPTRKGIRELGMEESLDSIPS